MKSPPTTYKETELDTYPRTLSPSALHIADQKLPGEFASALAHEVRNPLSTINLAVEMLRSTRANEDQKPYLDIIERNSGRINALVTDLLQFYQPGDLHLEESSPLELLEDVLSITNDRMELKKIEVWKVYCDLDRRILLNRQRIKIALTNIIINAIEAMPTENGKLGLITKSIKGKYVLEIVDNGIGISKANLRNVFKPYFTTKPGGMGLGLSTTLDILLSNQVEVDIESEVGKGTRFILSFVEIQQPRKSLQAEHVSIQA